MPDALKKITLPDFLSALRACCPDGDNELVDVLGNAAYALPLPAEWQEQVDQQGFVYFWNRASERSSWEHPLMASFVSIVKLTTKALETQLSLRDALSCIASHLRHAEKDAKEKLHCWKKMHDSGGSAFFHNGAGSETSWESPSDAAHHDLYARNHLLTCFLEHYYGRLADAGPRSRELVELPQQVRAYASWIQACLAAHAPKPESSCSLRAQPRHPPLPPFTALPLSRPGSGALAGQPDASERVGNREVRYARPLALPPRLVVPRELTGQSKSLPSLAKGVFGVHAHMDMATEPVSRRGIDSAGSCMSSAVRKPRAGIAYGEVQSRRQAMLGGA